MFESRRLFVCTIAGPRQAIFLNPNVKNIQSRIDAYSRVPQTGSKRAVFTLRQSHIQIQNWNEYLPTPDYARY